MCYLPKCDVTQSYIGWIDGPSWRRMPAGFRDNLQPWLNVSYIAKIRSFSTGYL